MAERSRPVQVLEYASPTGAPNAPVRLSIMMFLQWAVPGLWIPIMAVYLTATAEKGGVGFTGSQVGWIFGLAGAVGAAAAPFIAGQVADRWLNAERAMGLLLLGGGILQIILSQTTTFLPFLAISLCASVAFAPTSSLTNSISFHNLAEKERQFPLVRLWGTIGWVGASGLFGTIWLGNADPIVNTRRIPNALIAAGALAIVYAVYSLFILPRTPPKKEVQSPLAFAKAFGLFRHRGFLVLSAVAVPIAMVHSCYFMRTSPFLKQEIGIPERWIGWTMGIGQFSEIAFLAMLSLFLKQLGYKKVLIFGGLGYVARYAIFAWGQPRELVIAAQALHGVCFACFYAGAFLYVERIASADIRHSAQTVFALVLTVGPLMATFYNGYFDKFRKMGVEGVMVQDYRQFWLACAVVALGATVALALAFPSGAGAQPPPLPSPGAAGERGDLA